MDLLVGLNDSGSFPNSLRLNQRTGFFSWGGGEGGQNESGKMLFCFLLYDLPHKFSVSCLFSLHARWLFILKLGGFAYI